MFNPFYGKGKFIDMMSEVTTQINDMSSSMIKNYFDMMMLGAEDIVKSIGLRHVLRHKLIGGGLFPFITSMLNLEKKETDKFLSVLTGDSDENLQTYLTNLSDRIMSGMRYDFLVLNLGKELFGSAKFEGKKQLDENEFFTLTHLPVPKGTKKVATVFHVGGVLPYSDRLFRFLPEINFFDRFLERGIEVYAMELKGDKITNPNMGKLTFEKMIDSVHRFTDVAFKHNGNERMILEGYCGLGMQTASSFLAAPKEMAKKFSVVMLMVSPVDGRKCNELGDMMNLFPKSMMFMNLFMASMKDEFVKGDNLRRTIDIAKKSFYEKTPIGRFINGWLTGQWAKIQKVDDLDSRQRLDLAGAYWISPQNAGLFPVPISLSHFSTMIFTIGVSKDGIVPMKYKGRLLDFKDFNKTDVKLVTFYGELDAMVPTKTADLLENILDKGKFTHITHEAAGHVSYILSPKRWHKEHKRAFTPSVIDTVLDAMPKKATPKAAAKPAPKTTKGGK